MIEQTKTKPQETLEFKMNKEMQIFSFNPPIIISEEGKCLLAVTSFETTKSVFNITSDNKSFSISTPSFWNSEDCKELINKLDNLLKVLSENHIESHVKKLKKGVLVQNKKTMGIFSQVLITLKVIDLLD